VSGLLVDLSAEVRQRLARASAGNPLFAEELVAWTIEDRLDTAVLPTTLNALLGARLDQSTPLTAWPSSAAPSKESSSTEVR